jgi:hypothetical protein
LKYKIIFLTFALLILTSIESQAIILGVRLSDASQNPLPGISDTGNKGRFGFFLGTQQKNSTFLIGADYDRYKLERGDSLLYSRRLTVNIGYRYQLMPADKASAMSFRPFIALNIFKSFSKVNADTTVMPAAQATYLKDISNDSGGWLSVGAEYFFAPVFSFGAEGGLRYSAASSTALGYQVKIRDYSSFVDLLLTFYW